MKIFGEILETTLRRVGTILTVVAIAYLVLFGMFLLPQNRFGGIVGVTGGCGHFLKILPLFWKFSPPKSFKFVFNAIKCRSF